MYAFRCKNCGHLKASEHAGECNHPSACSVCGAGISYNQKTGVKIYEPENWEILADCTLERLTELDLDGEVERHEPCQKSTNQPKEIFVSADDSVGMHLTN